MRNQSRVAWPETNMFKILDSAIASLKTPIETIRLPQRRKPAD
jgi:hypothetical protein